MIQYDALMDFCADSRFCQFSLGSEPFQAWLCPVLDRQDAINRRFNRVLARFTIWSILFGLGAALGLGLLSFRLPGLN